MLVAGRRGYRPPMIRTRILAAGLVLGVPIVAGARLGDPEPAPAKADADAKADATVTDAAALEDDILGVIALPLAAADARDAGVEAEEVVTAIDAVDAAGASPSDATAVLTAEADATRKRGAKKGFGVWVRLQVADGKRGTELATLIAKKKAEYAEATDEQRAEIDAKLAALHDKAVEHRKRVHERRHELVAAGKKAKRIGEAELASLEKRLAKNDKRQARIEALIAKDPARKEELERVLTHQEKREAKLEKREDKVEERTEKLDDKLQKLEDKHEERKEKREEKREEIEAKRDEAKGDHGKHKGEGKGGK